MRYVIIGAGAVGGVVGARMHEAGHEVVFVERGDHHDAIARDGLRVESPDGAVTVRPGLVDHPSALEFTDRDVVVLAVQTQDTEAALEDLALHAPPSVPVVCLQNGVENERLALRRFEQVYAVAVQCSANYTRTGVLQAYSTPLTGILDIGRYPHGTDEVASQVAEAFRTSGLDSQPTPDVMRWKYQKLVLNLANAVDAICAPSADGTLAARARQEGADVLDAAGIEMATAAQWDERRGDLLGAGAVNGEKRPGGSTWQSLVRRTGRVESDYLNGEIVLLGRLHGVPTPVNALLQRLTNRLAAERSEPRVLAEEDVLAQLPA